ncbi:MAG: hypothetical protein AB8I08_05510 [Sandaracinaceae bacterium]
MKDRLLIALFSVGTVVGFGGGLFSMAFHHGHHAQRRQAAFEDHIADVCVDASRRAERRPDRHAEPPPRRVYVEERLVFDRRADTYDDDRGDWDRPPRRDRRRRRHRRHHPDQRE